VALKVSRFKFQVSRPRHPFYFAAGTEVRVHTSIGITSFGVEVLS
jgi:hypothetical protein